jgi:hypothetical protein
LISKGFEGEKRGTIGSRERARTSNPPVIDLYLEGANIDAVTTAAGAARAPFPST